ncbi:fluoride efflux transporter CrcB [Aeromicrobium sp. S22]|uniref:fluoride efflux transporter CrcB n=1 Tax=Aeromicrobium sp. S22 TaxID=2662029 RepID=UPI00129D8EC8|nr:fluoride efflux transporter CrcB [Aeromicrobium sp. S22]MRK03189.1 fluoride efflux transporter CrcB [Aeromicrobium sp. S22]
MTTLLMALAGGLGAGARWSVGAWITPRTSHRLPWATLVINVTGSFALGLLVGLATDSTWLTILGTGFLGGYTTFSTASTDTVQLAIDRRYAAAAVNASVMLVLGVAAAACGWTLAA